MCGVYGQIAKSAELNVDHQIKHVDQYLGGQIRRG